MADAIQALCLHVEGMIEDGLLARLDRVASVRGVSRSSALSDAARKWMQTG